MPTILAYGPEILALEPHFDGQTSIIYGYQRFFIKYNNTLYCNLLPAEDDWICVRRYELDETEMNTFESLFPNEYTFEKMSLDYRDTDPVEDFGVTYTGKLDTMQNPIQSEESSAYTLFDNLKILIDEGFAARFALSTHYNLESSLQNQLTSYFSLLDEVDIKACEKSILNS